MKESVQSLIARADKALTGLDTKAIGTIRQSIIKAQLDLEKKLSVPYQKASAEVSDKSREFREARARTLLDQLGNTLQVIDEKKTTSVLTDHLQTVGDLESQSAADMVSLYSPSAAASVALPVETIGVLASNAAARLAAHGEVFAQLAQQTIIDGMINGYGYKKTAQNLRNQTGIVLSRAETIVRTETLNASDIARRASYKKSDVEFVQRIATQDARVCGFCAFRAGKVYRIDEAPQSLHPNDRCYNAPWKPEWEKAGLIDEKFVRQHAEDAQARSKEPMHSGAAPFEKAAGKEPPQAVWTPKDGYVDKSIQVKDKPAPTPPAPRPAPKPEKAPTPTPASTPKPKKAPAPVKPAVPAKPAVPSEGLSASDVLDGIDTAKDGQFIDSLGITRRGTPPPNAVRVTRGGRVLYQLPKGWKEESYGFTRNLPPARAKTEAELLAAQAKKDAKALLPKFDKKTKDNTSVDKAGVRGLKAPVQVNVSKGTFDAVPFKSSEDAIKYMKEERVAYFDVVNKSVNPKEAANALGLYQAMLYKDINRGLRGGTLSELGWAATRDTVPYLDEAFRNAEPLQRSVVTYRGVREGFAQKFIDDHKAGKLVGSSWLEEGFSSTSVDPDVGYGYAIEGGKNVKAAVLMNVKIPKGTPAIYSDTANRELILPRDIRYTVVGFHTEVVNGVELSIVDLEVDPRLEVVREFDKSDIKRRDFITGVVTGGKKRSKS